MKLFELILKLDNLLHQWVGPHTPTRHCQAGEEGFQAELQAQAPARAPETSPSYLRTDYASVTWLQNLLQLRL